MSNSSAPRTVCDSLVNLSLIFAMLLIAFGCVCSDDNRSRGKSEIKPQSETANTKKTNRTKANTQSNTTKTSEIPDNGDFQVEYVDVEDSRYSQVNEEMRKEKVLEKAARDLNKSLALPHDITLVTRDCGEINAFYKKDDHSITMCYELMDYYYKLFRQSGDSEKEASQDMSDAMQFIFLHELGHALIDAYDLPVPGDEEDAADRLSSYINLEELGESGSRAAIAAADAFNFQSQSSASKELPFYDEHSLDQQRFYNILCSLYGSNPNKYGVLVERKLLPEQRAVRCPGEYQQIVKSWDKLLKPYRKQ